MIADDPYAAVTPTRAMTLTSDDIVAGEEKPLLFRDPAIGGENLSPQLRWSEFPSGTKSFALTCYDPDAPTGTGFVHWAVANIPLEITELARGQGFDHRTMPKGSLTIPNDYRLRRYVGANPPPGSGRHRYVFIIHAVDVERLDIDPELTPVVLGFNLHFHTLARGVLSAWVDSDTGK
ncbi:YbhB/YbcL family Raf kinase inhibitor-like protein [Arthrobacter bambusae]|uniref:YbhB/YbcL family Raf kinase inhibitor-like protein n=1 Tax=Arthrobacter bambusae TaxID=1338426 RepID=UPI001F506810|nr:YbhB/YbcL family Raf kinase inhibitor-like protein [Arthrobacter bambusae]MCI0144194.1 YbhB/YbcL family Raf kinase inhibitor-like protein [Arthrobacter bambusae]